MVRADIPGTRSRSMGGGPVAGARDLAARIEHTDLRPDATAAHVDRLCDEALEHGFAAVCVAGSRVERAARRLEGTPCDVVSVAGFPLGNVATAGKVAEARAVLEAGARGVDMVLDIGRLVEGDLAAVEADIAAVAELVRAYEGAHLKVILETALLDAARMRSACEAAERAGAHFVKTSTGFGPAGATVDAVRILRAAVGTRLGVKAAGGIRTAAAARALLEAGADRLGTSASVAIVREAYASASRGEAKA